MENSVTIKKSLVFVVLLLVTTTIFAQTGTGSGTSVAAGITAFYRTWLRPVLVIWAVYQLVIASITTAKKVKNVHGDESSDAIMGFFQMMMWPMIGLAVGEAGSGLYSVFGQ